MTTLGTFLNSIDNCESILRNKACKMFSNAPMPGNNLAVYPVAAYYSELDISTHISYNRYPLTYLDNQTNCRPSSS